MAMVGSFSFSSSTQSMLKSGPSSTGKCVILPRPGHAERASASPFLHGEDCGQEPTPVQYATSLTSYVRTAPAPMLDASVSATDGEEMSGDARTEAAAIARLSRSKGCCSLSRLGLRFDQ